MFLTLLSISTIILYWVYRVLPIDSIFLNSCYNSFCLLSAVKYLRHRRRQLFPLYSLYDSDAKTGICCNHLMWVVVVIELFILLRYYVLNWIFCFSLRREIFCEHWYYLKRVPSAFIVESLLTNPLSIPSPLVGSVESANHSVMLRYYLFVFSQGV